MINDITATSLSAFASNPPPGTSTSPFNLMFPSWFRDDHNLLNHLDSDIVLAFPSEYTDLYPNFHPFTDMFATDNALFLKAFISALNKMSRLGVDITLHPPGDCDGSPFARKRKLMSSDDMQRIEKVSIDEPGSLNVTQVYSLIRRFSDIETENAVLLASLLFARREEVNNATTPLFSHDGPSPSQPGICDDVNNECQRRNGVCEGSDDSDCPTLDCIPNLCGDKCVCKIKVSI